jgi:hypothetical protein
MTLVGRQTNNLGKFLLGQQTDYFPIQTSVSFTEFGKTLVSPCCRGSLVNVIHRAR